MAEDEQQRDPAAHDDGPKPSGPYPSWPIIGSYRVVRKLGEGGMGVVYSAEHLRLPRRAAVKLLKPSQAKSRKAVERFFREARAVNEIGHENIIDIIDFVADLDADPPLVYTVMELLEGYDLAAHIERHGLLDVEETIEIASPVLDALGAAHARNLIHRDLKPENIFLHKGADGVRAVKLLDFGVAKGFGPQHGADLTDPGVSIGTPQYMAPEQIQTGKIDVRTDIYAFGCVLYHMLTGRPPFKSAHLAKLLRGHVSSAPKPVNDRRTEPVPRRLEAVVMRCLAKHPASRYQTARELRSALLRNRPGRLSLGRLLSRAGRKPPTSARRRMLLLSGGVAVLLSGVGGILAWALTRGPLADRSEVPKRAANTSDAARAAGSRVAAAPATKVRARRDAAGRHREDHGKKEGRGERKAAAPAARRADRPARRGDRSAAAAGRSETAPARKPPGSTSRADRRRRGRLRASHKRAHGSGSLVVGTLRRGQPTWADVYLDGRRIGQTPLVIRRVSAGRHRLVIRRHGRRWTRAIAVRAGQRNTVSIRLDR